MDYSWAGLATLWPRGRRKSVVVSQGPPQFPAGGEFSSSELGIGATDQPGKVRETKLGVSISLTGKFLLTRCKCSGSLDRASHLHVP